ncbi:MAG TPA: XdhC family protein [Mycobacteriales bacterium]|jgi:xanthine dehydrogenase accessory factor|nr:XdhC family protein [Mycobacteriales bacterium]
MRDLRTTLAQWRTAGSPFAIATVVGVRGSAPREPGAVMAVAADGEVAGSVSGGCVEGAVYEAAMEVLDGAPARVETYGISDDEAFAVGLTCGGTLDVLVQPAPHELDQVLRSLAADEPIATATVVDGGEIGSQLVVWPNRATGSLGTEGLDVATVDDARGMLAQGLTGTRHYGPHGERRLDDVAVFVQSFAPPPRLLVFGAIDFAAAVARVGSFLGYHVTVCDARPVFATRKRFPEANEVICAWPHTFLQRTRIEPSTVICVLTHDPKFDVPVLEVALRSPAAYVGAMGSRRTHDDRLQRLRDAGLTDAELSRLHSPIGLDIGARTPEETALSIAAEFVSLRWGGSGQPLRDVSGPLHGGRDEVGRNADIDADPWDTVRSLG